MCTFDCRKIGCLAAVLALLPIGTLDDAKPTDTVRILFVGNSYTYVNNLPAMLAALSRSAGDLFGTTTSPKVASRWKSISTAAPPQRKSRRRIGTTSSYKNKVNCR